MTTTDMLKSFLAGHQLPTLGTRQARALLDACRDRLLTLGRKLRPSTATTPDSLKTELLQAHRELVGGDAVYAMATTGEAQLCNGVSNDRLLDEYEKFKRTNPNGSFLTHMATMGSDPSAPPRAATPSAPARPSVRPATTATTRQSPAKSPTPAKSPARPTATPPRKETNEEFLSRRVREQALARPPAATTAKPPARPLKDLPAGELVRRATHEFSPPADAQAAADELRRRPEISFLPSGSYTVSAGRAKP
jgi:hypothetical protein